MTFKKIAVVSSVFATLFVAAPANAFDVNGVLVGTQQVVSVGPQVANAVAVGISGSTSDVSAIAANLGNSISLGDVTQGINNNNTGVNAAIQLSTQNAVIASQTAGAVAVGASLGATTVAATAANIGNSLSTGAIGQSAGHH